MLRDAAPLCFRLGVLIGLSMRHSVFYPTPHSLASSRTLGVSAVDSVCTRAAAPSVLIKAHQPCRPASRAFTQTHPVPVCPASQLLNRRSGRRQVVQGVALRERIRCLCAPPPFEGFNTLAGVPYTRVNVRAQVVAAISEVVASCQKHGIQAATICGSPTGYKASHRNLFDPIVQTGGGAGGDGGWCGGGGGGGGGGDGLLRQCV